MAYRLLGKAIIGDINYDIEVNLNNTTDIIVLDAVYHFTVIMMNVTILLWHMHQMVLEKYFPLMAVSLYLVSLNGPNLLPC